MQVIIQDYIGCSFYIEDFVNPAPVKKMINLDGKPYFYYIFEALKRCKKVDEIIFLVQDTEENKEIIETLKIWNLNFYIIGSPWNWKNCLEYYNKIENDIVIAGRNISPLTNPTEIDRMVDYFISKDLDYLENLGFPLYCIFKGRIWKRLYDIERNFKSLVLRDWAKYVKEKTHLFKSDTFKICMDELNYLGNNPKFWVPRIRKIIKKFYRPESGFNLNEISALYNQNPDWFEFLPESEIEIEVTNDCNLKCIMCPRTEKMTREIGYMDFELFKKIIDKTEALSIHFSGFGEPLLHPHIKDMFTYAKKKELEIGLWTNGVFLNEEISRKIIEEELLDYIIFSLDASTKETYFKIKKVNCFDKVVENINKFLEIKKNLLIDKPKVYGLRKPLVGIQILRMKENDAEIEEFMEIWDMQERLRKRIGQKKEEPLNWIRFYDTEEILHIEHAIIGHYNNFCGEIEDISVLDVTPLKRFPCKQLQNGISILCNGNVVFCRQDFDGKYSLGNLKNQSLQDILENKRLANIWRVHHRGEYHKIPICKNCRDWYYNAYA
jgi:radical SAM protein with 4Fe4S-binding SPASM domain